MGQVEGVYGWIEGVGLFVVESHHWRSKFWHLRALVCFNRLVLFPATQMHACSSWSTFFWTTQSPEKPFGAYFLLLTRQCHQQYRLGFFLTSGASSSSSSSGTGYRTSKISLSISSDGLVYAEE